MQGQRIDNFLAGELKGVPRSLIYRVLRKGEVRVNKGRIKPEYRLRQGDQVRIPPVRLGQPQTPRVPETVQTQLRNAVLFEDDEVMVLDKPAGLAVHGGSGLGFGIIEALRRFRPAAHFLELVHRLDRETSGCLLLAKSRPALLALQEQLKSGASRKALPGADLRQLGPGNSDRGCTVAQKLAQQWRTHGSGQPRRASRPDPIPGHDALPGCHPGRGVVGNRTHPSDPGACGPRRPSVGWRSQIRRRQAFDMRLRGLGLKRMFLHAHRLGFSHPSTGERLDLGSPLPEPLRAVLQAMEREQ